MGRRIIICPNCRRQLEHHAKGYCYTCYKKLAWTAKKIICKRCKRLIKHQAKGLCPGCYNTTFHLDRTKAQNYEKYHNISIDLYKKITQKCAVCGFDKVVSLHHLDENKKNNSEENLIGLCPNHHQMIHMLKWREEVLTQLHKTPENEPLFSLPQIKIKLLEGISK